MIGRLLAGRYRVNAVLGRGGVGVVYRAEHVALGRPVALKVLSPEFGHREDLRIRFQREAKALSTVAHPHVVAINDFGTSEDVTYLVMELLEGRTLQERLASGGPLDPDEALDVTRGILRGLAFAHARGILHRDLKPGNVFLKALPDDAAHVKLLDFGLAKAIDEGASDGEPPLTRLGTVLGTPAYMSPEQAAGAATDARTDVYSVGIVFFELLAGRPPFVADTRAELMRAHMLEKVPLLGDVRPRLRTTPELDRWIGRALAKEPRHRFADASEMLTALDALPRPAARLDGSPDHAVFAAPSGEAETALARGGAPRPRAISRKAHAMPNKEPVSREEPSESAAPLIVTASIFVALVALGAALATNFFGLRDAGEPPAPASSAKPEPVAAGPSSSGEGPSRVEAPRAPVEENAPKDPVPAPHPEEDSAELDRPPARNLLAGRLPRELRSIVKRVHEGEPLTRSQTKALRRYQQKKPSDPRAMLLLAHDFVHRNWLNDAVARYEAVYRMDPSSRGDPRMLRYLLKIASTDAAGTRAAETIATIYGSEAISAVERAIEGAEDPSAKARWSSLRAKLGAAPTP